MSERALPFVSEETENMLRDELRRNELRLSVMKKSVRRQNEYDEEQILRGYGSMPREARELAGEIVCARTFLHSYEKAGLLPPLFRESDADFRYRLTEEGRKHGKYLLIWLTGRGIVIRTVSDTANILCASRLPLLAIDLCEHAYIRDYGFEKGDYLRAASVRMDLSVLKE